MPEPVAVPWRSLSSPNRLNGEDSDFCTTVEVTNATPGASRTYASCGVSPVVRSDALDGAAGAEASTVVTTVLVLSPSPPAAAITATTTPPPSRAETNGMTNSRFIGEEDA